MSLPPAGDPDERSGGVDTRGAVPEHSAGEVTEPLSATGFDEGAATCEHVEKALRHAVRLLDGVVATSEERLALLGRVKHWTSTALLGVEAMLRRSAGVECTGALERARHWTAAAQWDVEQLISLEQTPRSIILVGRPRHALAMAQASIARSKGGPGDAGAPEGSPW